MAAKNTEGRTATNESAEVDLILTGAIPRFLDDLIFIDGFPAADDRFIMIKENVIDSVQEIGPTVHAVLERLRDPREVPWAKALFSIVSYRTSFTS